MLACHQCGAVDVFTCRGVCARCARELHAQRAGDLAAFARDAEAYERETGREAIVDLDAFEAWRGAGQRV